MGLTTSLAVQIRALLTATAVLGGTPTVNHVKNFEDELASGTGLDQADVIYTAELTINATTNHDLDLSGALENALGGAAVFARLKLVYVELVTTTAGYTLEVGGSAADVLTLFKATGDADIVCAGGLMLRYAPGAAAYVVTATTADILRIRNPNAASVSVRVLIIGASA